MCGTQSCQIKLGVCVCVCGGGFNSLLIILKALRASQHDIVYALIGALAAQLFIRNFCKSQGKYIEYYIYNISSTYDS